MDENLVISSFSDKFQIQITSFSYSLKIKSLIDILKQSTAWLNFSKKTSWSMNLLVTKKIVYNSVYSRTVNFKPADNSNIKSSNLGLDKICNVSNYVIIK